MKKVAAFRLCLFDLCLQPKQKIEPLFSLPITTDHILPVLKHIVSLPHKGKTELLKCVFSLSQAISVQDSGEVAGGGRWSLRYSFLTLTLFCTQVCDCPLPACFKPTAIPKVQLPDSRPYPLVLLLPSCQAFKYSPPRVCVRCGGRQPACLWRKGTEPWLNLCLCYL